jgi:hypothetical protein
MSIAVNRLLTPDCAVLIALGEKIPFELAVGLNGRVCFRPTAPHPRPLSAVVREGGCWMAQVWLNSAQVEQTVLLSNAIENAQLLTPEQVTPLPPSPPPPLPHPLPIPSPLPPPPSPISAPIRSNQSMLHSGMACRPEAMSRRSASASAKSEAATCHAEPGHSASPRKLNSTRSSERPLHLIVGSSAPDEAARQRYSAASGSAAPMALGPRGSACRAVHGRPRPAGPSMERNLEGPRGRAGSKPGAPT